MLFVGIFTSSTDVMTLIMDGKMLVWINVDIKTAVGFYVSILQRSVAWKFPKFSTLDSNVVMCEDSQTPFSRFNWWSPPNYCYALSFGQIYNL
jgi:hypothetical protein